MKKESQVNWVWEFNLSSQTAAKIACSKPKTNFKWREICK